MSKHHKKLSLRDVNRLLRPVSDIELVAVESWNDIISDIVMLLSDSPKGALFLLGEDGSGKSSLLKQIMNQATQRNLGHCILGTIGEPIKNSGWLLRFLSEILAGHSEEKMSQNELVARISEIATQHTNLVIFIDNLNLVERDVIFSDIKGFLAITEAMNLSVFLLCTGPANLHERVKSFSSPAGINILFEQIPRCAPPEIQSILNYKILSLQSQETPKGQALENIISTSQGNPGAAIIALIDYLKNNRQKGDQFTSEAEKSKAHTKSPNKRSFDEFLKSSTSDMVPKSKLE